MSHDSPDQDVGPEFAAVGIVDGLDITRIHGRFSRDCIDTIPQDHLPSGKVDPCIFSSGLRGRG
jgi:hypothetical protein